jgi:hypothetical protein
LEDIDFCDQVEGWYEEIKSASRRYQEILHNALRFSDRAKKPSGSIVEATNLDELQISPMLEEKFRDRLSKPLEGHKWVSECHMYILEEVKEKAENGVFAHSISELAES